MELPRPFAPCSSQYRDSNSEETTSVRPATPASLTQQLPPQLGRSLLNPGRVQHETVKHGGIGPSSSSPLKMGVGFLRGRWDAVELEVVWRTTVVPRVTCDSAVGKGGPDPVPLGSSRSSSRGAGGRPCCAAGSEGDSCPVHPVPLGPSERRAPVHQLPAQEERLTAGGGEGGAQGSDLATCVVSAHQATSPTAKNVSPQGHQHLRKRKKTKEKGLRRNRDNKARRRRKAKITSSEILERVLHPKTGRGYRERTFSKRESELTNETGEESEQFDGRGGR